MAAVSADATAASVSAGSESPEAFCERINRQYETVHKAYEDNFWATRMDLTGNSRDAETASKCALDAFLGSEELLQQVQTLLQQADLAPDTKKTLECFERTFKCYILRDPKARSIRDQLIDLEAKLAETRGKMELGYTHNGTFTRASSVQLRNLMRSSDDASLRLACYEALRSIGPVLLPGLCEIVKLRNLWARSLGYVDYYDMKVSQAEGFDKKTLFTIMEDLEVKTRAILSAARATLAAQKGPDALLPQNTGYFLAGDVTKLKDPYFAFSSAVDVWARSFAALGITYRGATMRLDLCDRQGKYSNGFCHWPQPAWQSPSGWVPSSANFTSLADPKAVGSGLTAITTLMHEAGHAAHFANVVQPSPLFSQERAPTSVAYAENQSMFLDSVVQDAAWMGRYAVSGEGKVIPWEIIEQDMRATHEYKVFALRGMIAVPFFEKALYELSEEECTPERVQALADAVERDIQGGLSGRPLLSVPHIISDESSAYYHGYVLAEMSVHQTRAHFLKTYGHIVDNPRVGADLRDIYWKAGNSEPFMSLVQRLTARPLSADDWVEHLQEPLDKALVSEKAAYDEAVKSGPALKAGSEAKLDMRVLLVHGDQLVADSAEAGLVAACGTYAKWLDTLKI